MYIPGAWTLKQLITDPGSLFDRSPKNPDGTKILTEESELVEMFLKEPIDIWVNSFGGGTLKLHRKPAGAQIHCKKRGAQGQGVPLHQASRCGN